MGWADHVFNYCERGLDPSFWAEPFNAVSNGAFIVAALASGIELRKLQDAPSSSGDDRTRRIWLWSLVALVAVIGAGSFLFHTYAARWALLADVIPISLFMVAYLAFALRHFLGLGWLPILIVLPVFMAAGTLAGDLTCPGGSDATAGEPCLNGSLGYVPALLALVIVGGLAAKRQAQGKMLLVAAALFLLSVTLRTIDRDVCAATALLGRLRGTHALWHVLNAVTLYVLLKAAIAQARLDAPRASLAEVAPAPKLL